MHDKIVPIDFQFRDCDAAAYTGSAETQVLGAAIGFFGN